MELTVVEMPTTKWRCVVCARAGAIENTQHSTVRSVVADVREDHAAKSPWCDFERDFVRVELDLSGPQRYSTCSEPVVRGFPVADELGLPEPLETLDLG